MENTFFESGTFGIGQLIAQKKRFQVPLHQRNYSWNTAQVEQFLEDVFTAIDEEYSSYFLGSIVLTKPTKGTWGILDGQQRITTVSIVYSTIRYLLESAGYHNDAAQIESEFIGVRNLGGSYSSRLVLNSENEDLYEKAVVKVCSDEELTQIGNELNSNRSNSLLLNAIKICRKRINEWSRSPESEEEQLFRLYRLSDYLESKILVVSIEVADESDAFVVFETLNTRGQDLSALDLVKNYIFSSVDTADHESISHYWSLMKDNIGEKQADDFLRIFWMGKYGLIQKSRLYPNLKRKYDTTSKAKDLCYELSEGSFIYSAIEEPKHEFWYEHSALSKHLVATLALLKSKQVRPIIFASHRFHPSEMEKLLWMLVVLTVRFQTIGKNRQGIIEKQSARIAQRIANLGTVNIDQIKEEILEILPSDDDFKRDFARYQETNKRKLLYFLCSIEYTNYGLENYANGWENLEDALESKSEVELNQIIPRSVDLSAIGFSAFKDNANVIIDNIANQALVGSIANQSLKGAEVVERVSVFGNSVFRTTAEIGSEPQWNIARHEARVSSFANAAVQIWKIND